MIVIKTCLIFVVFLFVISLIGATVLDYLIYDCVLLTQTEVLVFRLKRCVFRIYLFWHPGSECLETRNVNSPPTLISSPFMSTDTHITYKFILIYSSLDIRHRAKGNDSK